MFKNDFWELDIHKNPLLFFLGIQLGYIFQFPLHFSAANAVWTRQLCLSPRSAPLNLPNLIFFALYSPVCSMSMPGQHWMPCVEVGRDSISLGAFIVLWDQTGNALNCLCEGEIDSNYTWAFCTSLDVFVATDRICEKKICINKFSKQLTCQKKKGKTDCRVIFSLSSLFFPASYLWGIFFICDNFKNGY